LQLATQFGVDVSTIARDIARIREQIALEGDSDARRFDTAEQYAAIAFENLELARANRKMSDTARASFYRVALDALAKRALLRGENAPTRTEQDIEQVIRIEHHNPELAAPIPFAGRNYLPPGTVQDRGDGAEVGQDDDGRVQESTRVN
jgi:hypothetical protein